MLFSNWMVMNKKVLPIGLDIGHSSIKMVQLALTDDGAKVLAAQRASLPDDANVDDTTRRQAIVSTVRQMLSHGNFKGHEVISALPNEKLRITSLRLSESETSQADKTLQSQAAQRFGLDPRRDTIHHIPAGSVRQGDELKSEYILLGTDSETISGHISLLEQTRLTPVGIDTIPCALFRSFDRLLRRQEDKERTIIFIDVGYRYTTVVIGRAGEICFVKQLSFGVARFNEEIAAQLDISPKDAESLRWTLHNGEAVEDATARLITDTLKTTSERLAAEISLCLRYYTVTFRGRRIERAVVTGGGVNETAIINVLRSRLGVDTEIAEPLRGFDCSGVVSDENHLNSSADFAPAVGLSLKGVPHMAESDNLAEAKREQVLEGQLS